MLRVLPLDVWDYILRLSNNPITVTNFVMTCKRVWNRLRDHQILMDWRGLSETKKLERACLKGYVEVVKLLKYDDMKFDGMCWASQGGHLSLVEFFISKGISDWEWGMYYAAQGGHLSLVEFFISKGASDWDRGMLYAAQGGHLSLVEFFISKGADNIYECINVADREHHRDVVNYFQDLK
jgi:hypothetical protein